MKRILFITHNRIKMSDGVSKKILQQVNALRKKNNVTFTYMGVDNSVIFQSNNREIKCCLFNKFLFYKKSADLLNGEKYDIVYARKPHGGLYSIFFNFFLRHVIKNNPSCKIYIEIPTYPYLEEIVTWKDKISEFFFNVSKLFFIKKIHSVAYIGEPIFNTIWGVQAIPLANGVDVEKYHFIDRVKNHKKYKNEVVLTGVANLAFWHGYDRIINSLLNYSGDIKVKLFIVGGFNNECLRLMDIAGNDERIIFTGELSGEELDNILNVTDICIDSLGRHRSGNNYNSSIKSKEYCARGIPFIKSHFDSSFGDEKFIYNVSPDENSISLLSILNWYNNLPGDISILEREFAMDYLSWDEQFKFLN